MTVGGLFVWADAFDVLEVTLYSFVALVTMDVWLEPVIVGIVDMFHDCFLTGLPSCKVCVSCSL